MTGMLMKKSRIVSAVLLGMFSIVSLGIWGCGSSGTKGYDAPVDPATTTKTPAVIDATTLKQWVDEGKLNAPLGSPDRVVLVSMTTLKNYTTISKKHIPGAVLMDTATDLYATRTEGLGPVGSMVPTGAQMDTVIQKLGIDNHTTIVLTIPKTSSDAEHYPQSRAYFTFRYWGFDRNRVKILSGGDDAWDLASLPLVKNQPPAVTPSSYSVARNKGLKDIIRYSFGEMLGLVDAINTDSSLLNTWQVIDLRGPTTATFMANAKRGAPFQFFTRLNSDPARNWQYPDSATLNTRLAAITVNNPDLTTSFLSPTKKTVVMCGSAISASPSFVLFDAVLGLPEGDIMMYDGSSSQWTGYSVANITAVGATAAQANLWGFNALTPGTANARSIGALTGTNTLLPSNYVYSPFQVEMNQIEKADKAYITPGGTGTTTTGTGGSTGGGC